MTRLNAATGGSAVTRATIARPRSSRAFTPVRSRCAAGIGQPVDDPDPAAPPLPAVPVAPPALDPLPPDPPDPPDPLDPVPAGSPDPEPDSRLAAESRLASLPLEAESPEAESPLDDLARVFDRRSTFAHPDPLNTIAGGANARRMGAPQAAHGRVASSWTPCMTSAR